jgi:hypothetical protein
MSARNKNITWWRASTAIELPRIKCTAKLHPRGRFTIILGYELYSLLKTMLWLWNAEQLWQRCSFAWCCVLGVMLDNLSCSFTSMSFLTNQYSIERADLHRLGTIIDNAYTKHLYFNLNIWYILNITCQNLHHMPYQPENHISPHGPL